jgi:anti-sigma factor RsiW
MSIMKRKSVHLSEEQLLRQVDGECSAREARTIRAHLETCWACRTRKQELEGAISDFVHVYQEEYRERVVPPAEGPRALLKAQMAMLAGGAAQKSAGLPWFLAAAACGLLVALAVYVVGWQGWFRHQTVVFSAPNARLTPGAAVLVSREQLCSQASTNNKDVPEWMKREVFQEYGIRNATAGAYEVDYLITPALGGADDIRNLWPHSYQQTVWNAKVKDELESRLREMVCDGSLDLNTAQQEIASNWIAAYKQYFHTEKPLGRAGY